MSAGDQDRMVGRLERIRQDYRRQVPERVEEARLALEGMRAGQEPARDTLHRLLHNLKGTSRSLGFAEVGAAAEACEELLVATPAGRLPDLEALEDALEALARTSVEGRHQGTGLESAPSPEAAEPSAEGTPGRDVYLCDDDAFLAAPLALQLGYFGYQVQVFEDPDQLRKAILARRPAALVMDITFPGHRYDGPEALRELWKEMGFRIPTAFLSGRGDFQARLDAVQAGASAYLVKPVRALDLVPVLDDLTRRRSPEPYRILIVDDDAPAAAYHACILQEAGMLTSELTQPERLLEVLQEFRPDMVLMDIYMPGGSGMELARVIRQVPNHFGLPIVYLSSETDKRKQFSAMRVGSEGFITKPVVPEDLVASVAIGAERMRALQGLMARDSLTGLFNHTTTTQLLERALAVARRQGTPLTFCMLDIDHFKQVNDTHGHPVGDQVLLAVSRVLGQRLRETDIVGRYGGEEFAVILPGMAIQGAHALLDGLRKDFAKLIFHGEGPFSTTFSAGLAAFPANRSVEQLRSAADRALYQAKGSGRNQVVADGGLG